jgi:hypothetical protein
MFEVYDEDEDFPTSRRGDAIAPRKPARKPRRKSSGSKGLVIGLSIGGGTLLLILVLVLVLVVFGDSAESLMKDMLASEEEKLKILKSMTDEASARAGLPRLIENNTELAGLYRRMVRLAANRTQVENTEFAREITRQLTEIERQQEREKDRIRDIPGGEKILSEADRDGYQKLSAIQVEK